MTAWMILGFLMFASAALVHIIIDDWLHGDPDHPMRGG